MPDEKVSEPSRYKIKYMKFIQLVLLQLAGHLHEGLGCGHSFPSILHQVNIEGHICDIKEGKQNQIVIKTSQIEKPKTASQINGDMIEMDLPMTDDRPLHKWLIKREPSML